jgi:flagellar motor protein MotB
MKEIREALVIVFLVLGGCGPYATQRRALPVCQGALLVCRGDLDNANLRAEKCSSEMGGMRRVADAADARVDDVTRLGGSLEPAGRELGATWTVRNGNLVAEIPGDKLFERGDAVISSLGREGISRLAGAFSEAGDHHITVIGHADDSRPKKRKSPEADNWELSISRALAVARELETGGVPSARLVAAGAGDHQPIATENSASESSLNRRVEIWIAPHDDKRSTLHRVPVLK